MLTNVAVLLVLSWFSVTGEYHEFKYPEPSVEMCRMHVKNFFQRPDGNMTTQHAECQVREMYVR